MSQPKYVEEFRCPACHGGLRSGARFSQCVRCGGRYMTLGGIPLLVRNQAEHLAAIESARVVNPGWYEREQPPEVASPWRHHLRRRRLYVTSVIKREMARRGLDKSCRLLDLGCGDGNNLAWLGEFSDNLYGSDYNLLRLVRAQKKVSARQIFLANILDYPVEDNFFDIIYFNHVIEHIPQDLAALQEVRRILKPGGVLVLGAPNQGCWWWQLALKRAPGSLLGTDHVHFYTARILSCMMRKARLEVFESKGMGFGPPDHHLDEKIRKYKLVDDVFELLGQVFMPSQASSLYLIATKGA